MVKVLLKYGPYQRWNGVYHNEGKVNGLKGTSIIYFFFNSSDFVSLSNLD